MPEIKEFSSDIQVNNDHVHKENRCVFNATANVFSNELVIAA